LFYFMPIGIDLSLFVNLPPWGWRLIGLTYPMTQYVIFILK